MKSLTDISLVAYLQCKGFKIKKIDKGKEARSTFIFEDSPELEKEIIDFFNHDAKIDPLLFSETLRNLKSYARQGSRKDDRY